MEGLNEYCMYAGKLFSSFFIQLEKEKVSLLKNKKNDGYLNIKLKADMKTSGYLCLV